MDKNSPADLLARPFDLRLPPDWVFEHASWRRARQTALEALAAGWVAVLIGDSGVGKTLLLRDLARALTAGGLRIRISEVGDDPGPATPGEVRLVDEADALGEEALRGLVLVGGPAVIALRPRSAPPLEGLPARVALVRLLPLSPAEAADFVAAALDAGQIRRDLFGEAAVAALAVASGGLPRLLTVLTRGALFQAQLEGAPCVEARHIELAEALRSGVEREVVEAAPAQAGCIDCVAGEWSQNAPVGSVPAAATAAPADFASAPVAGAAGPVPPASEVVALPAVAAAPSRPAAGPLVQTQPPGRLALAVALSLTVSIVAGWFLLGQRSTPEASNARRSAPPRSGARPPPTLAVGRGRPTDASGLVATDSVAVAPPYADAIPRPNAAAPGAGTVDAVAGGHATPPASESVGSPRRDAAHSPGSPAPVPPRPGPRPAAVEAPPPGAAMTSARDAGTFRGPTYNETLGLGGRLRLSVDRTGPGDTVAVRFEASGGLLGVGQLTGRLTPDGRLVARGTLMMGRTPFETELDCLISGDLLVGSARYTRRANPGGGPVTAGSSTRGTFRLSRS